MLPEHLRQIQVSKETLRKHKITLETYKQMLAEQDYRCAICKSFPAGKVEMVIDHDHATNRVRGLLCANCNTGLGMFHDSANVMLSAAAYLSKSGTAENYLPSFPPAHVEFFHGNIRDFFKEKQGA